MGHYGANGTGTTLSGVPHINTVDRSVLGLSATTMPVFISG